MTRVSNKELQKELRQRLAEMTTRALDAENKLAPLQRFHDDIITAVGSGWGQETATSLAHMQHNYEVRRWVELQGDQLRRAECQVKDLERRLAEAERIILKMTAQIYR